MANPTLNWEPIDDGGFACVLARTKIPGGWLLRLVSVDKKPTLGLGITFVPDPNHEWDGKSIK